MICNLHNDIKGQRFNGEQCMGKCISTDGFSMTAVPLGKLQHKVSYLLNSGGCKMCVDPSHKFHMIFSSGHLAHLTSLTIH